jgi:hypothetical protein
LGICQHMYHSQCLIILMVTRRRCPQHRSPFHRHSYEQFNFWVAMPQHEEYNKFNTPNRSQAWGTNMKWIWNVGMFIITWGSQYNQWQYDKSMIQMHVNCCTSQWLIHDVVGFIKCFKVWYNPRTNKFEYSLNSEHVWYNVMGEEIG